MKAYTKEQVDDLLDNVIGVTKRVGWKDNKQQFTCPIHQESNPSCGININYVSDDFEEGVTVFNCFSCGASGTIPWLLFKSLPDKFKSIKSVEDFLEDRYGIVFSSLKNVPVEIRQYEDVEEIPERAVMPRSKLAVFQSGKRTYQYFYDRGFDEEDRKKYMIGCDLENQTVTIPVYYADGKLAGIIGRYVDESRPKNMRYKIYNFQKGNVLYPLDKLSVSYDTLIVVESMFDVIMMNKWGYDNVVAIMGSSITKVQADLIVSRCKKVILLFDNDARGLASMYKHRDILKKSLITLIPNYYPEKGKDPCEWGREQTALVIKSASMISPIPMVD